METPAEMATDTEALDDVTGCVDISDSNKRTVTTPSYDEDISSEMIIATEPSREPSKMSHANIKPFTCDICSKRFDVQSKLRFHQYKKHNKTPTCEKEKSNHDANRADEGTDLELTSGDKNADITEIQSDLQYTMDGPSTTETTENEDNHRSVMSELDGTSNAEKKNPDSKARNENINIVEKEIKNNIVENDNGINNKTDNENIKDESNSEHHNENCTDQSVFEKPILSKIKDIKDKENEKESLKEQFDVKFDMVPDSKYDSKHEIVVKENPDQVSGNSAVELSLGDSSEKGEFKMPDNFDLPEEFLSSIKPHSKKKSTKKNISKSVFQSPGEVTVPIVSCSGAKDDFKWSNASIRSQETQSAVPASHQSNSATLEKLPSNIEVTDSICKKYSFLNEKYLRIY